MPRNGAVLWSRNAATDTGVEVPGWGFAGSPLVIDEVVIVALSGRLVGYDTRTGDRSGSVRRAERVTARHIT